MDSGEDIGSMEEEKKENSRGPYDSVEEDDLMEKLRETVQNPGPGLIRFSDLQWLPHETTGRGRKVFSEIVVIRWDRLINFVQGQEQNPEFPATFNRHVRRSNAPGSLANPRATSPAQIIRYHCYFGPENHADVLPEDIEALLDSTIKKRRQVALDGKKKQRGKKVIPEYDVFSMTQPPKQKASRIGKKQTGRSIKRGCRCCFIVKQPYEDFSLCQIMYHHPQHTDVTGKIVHGTTVAGFKDSLGSGLSDGMKQHLSNLLWLGLSPSQVMSQHKNFVKELAMQNSQVSRDTFVQAQDVRNLAKVRSEALWQKHPNDPKSVKMWTTENPECVFCYREHSKLDLNKKKQEDTPFILGIQTPWQLEMLIKFGNRSALAFNATFGTSETRCREKDLEFVLVELRTRAHEKDLSWMPSSIIVDNAQAEINVLSKVWPQSEIFLCLWHVRKSWREHAVKKISTIGERGLVLNAMGRIMYGVGMELGCDPVAWAQEEIDKLTTEREKASSFMNYINTYWHEKAGMWCVKNRTISHAGQNTNAAIESYHGNLKSILRSSRERFDGRRLDWLIFHLVGDVVTHYWYAVQCKLLGFVRNRNQERIVATAIVRAKGILDSSVRLYPGGEDVALVASTNHRPQVWTISSPDSEWAQCDCPVGLQGMICKHTVKVFHLLHPTISDGMLLKEAGTTYGVNKSIPLAEVFSSAEFATPETPGLCFADDQGEDGMENAHDQDMNVIVPSPRDQDIARPARNVSALQAVENAKAAAQKLYCSLLETAGEHPQLLDFLLADLKIARGKQFVLIARGFAGIHNPESIRVFHVAPGDKSLKRYRSFLEPKSRKVPRTRKAK